MSDGSLIRIWQRFVLGVSANWVSKIGAALTTGSFLLLVLFQVESLTGALLNPYFDMVAFLTLPTLMAAGLILVAVGWLLLMRKLRRDGGSIALLLQERFGEHSLRGGAWGTRLLWTVLGLTAVNMLFLGVISREAKQFMDSREFCGTACHVMDPEWVAYQAGPHSGVDCVECHVGEGMGALIESKIGGARQMWREMTNTYSRPIPTPVHQFRAANETCARCHSSAADHGEKIVVREHFAHDEPSTSLVSALRLRLGGGESGGIHWHARSDVSVRFASIEGRRQQMRWVEVTRPDGTKERFARPGTSGEETGSAASEETEVRTMDCADCHNRTGHPFQSSDAALDEALATGRIERSLPRIKDKAEGLLTGAVPEHGPGDTSLERLTLALQRYLLATAPEASHKRRAEIERAGATLGAIYQRNVHPEMKIGWDTYPDHSGHQGQSGGCFRCHAESLKSATGGTIPSDCSTCHEILADGVPGTPEKLLGLRPE